MQVKSVTTICTIQIRMSPVIIWLQICEEVKHYHFRKATILTWILIMTGLKMQNFTGQKMKFYIKDLFSKCETEVDPSFVIIIKLLSNAIAESFCERIESNV